MRLEATFLKSCSALAQLPDDNIVEAAALGRSNVGKSSLLNRLLGHASLARVSNTPGRTRLLNLFDVRGLQPSRLAQPQLRLVDCPGYGYARISRSVSAEWGELMRQYLDQRRQLALCLLLVDAMLEPQAMDLDLFAWLRQRCRPTLLVATKWDRLSGNQQSQASRRLQAAFQEPVIGFSAITGEGRDPILAALKSLIPR